MWANNQINSCFFPAFSVGMVWCRSSRHINENKNFTFCPKTFAKNRKMAKVLIMSLLSIFALKCRCRIFFANLFFCHFICIICEKTLFLYRKNPHFWASFFARVWNSQMKEIICENFLWHNCLIMRELWKTTHEKSSVWRKKWGTFAKNFANKCQ